MITRLRHKLGFHRRITGMSDLPDVPYTVDAAVVPRLAAQRSLADRGRVLWDFLCVLREDDYKLREAVLDRLDEIRMEFLALHELDNSP